jgi:hypothetical protein
MTQTSRPQDGAAFFCQADCLLSVDLTGRRRFDRIFVSARRSLEPSTLLDHQCSMENITFNDTGAIYLDAVGADGALKVAANCHADGALKVAANCQFLCDYVTHDLCAFGDHDIRGAYLSLDATKIVKAPWPIILPTIERPELIEEAASGCDPSPLRASRRISSCVDATI